MINRNPNGPRDSTIIGLHEAVAPGRVIALPGSNAGAVVVVRPIDQAEVEEHRTKGPYTVQARYNPGAAGGGGVWHNRQAPDALWKSYEHWYRVTFCYCPICQTWEHAQAIDEANWRCAQCGYQEHG